MFRIINSISRYIVAAVFIISGFVKLVDPYGTAYKITDYLETVNIILPLWLATTASIILSLTEFTLGLNAFFKVNYKGTSKIILALVSFFFVITLIIAITNPVQDCGCFGDALVISNWATFFKNVALLFLSFVMFKNCTFVRCDVKWYKQRTLSLIFIAFGFVISIYSIRHLPFIDFRPYKVGTYIPEKMKVPAGLPQDKYETTFIYEKDSVQQKFTQENYPWQDTTWTYVSSKSVLIEKGAEPPIHDFVIEHPEWGDITEDVLHDPSYTFLLVSPNIEKASLKNADKIEALAKFAEENAYRFLVLTSSIGAEVQEFTQNFSTLVTVCSMDEITLKTIVRGYPGLVILKDGIILEKYNHNDIPLFDSFTNVGSEILSAQERQKTQIIVLLLALILSVVAFMYTKTKY